MIHFHLARLVFVAPNHAKLLILFGSFDLLELLGRELAIQLANPRPVMTALLGDRDQDCLAGGKLANLREGRGSKRH